MSFLTHVALGQCFITAKKKVDQSEQRFQDTSLCIEDQGGAWSGHVLLLGETLGHCCAAYTPLASHDTTCSQCVDAFFESRVSRNSESHLPLLKGT